MNRSYLFVPADNERKMKKAVDAGADALIVDLEDSVAPEAKPSARELCREFLANRQKAWVRINSLDTEDAAADLEAVVPAAPVGIVLPKANGASDMARLAAMLDSMEKASSIEAGQTAILPICTETPAAIFRLGEYAGSTPRLAAITWGAEDLSAAVGATTNRADDGAWLAPYEVARSLCLFGASAAEVPAIDTVYTDFRDLEGLATYAANARRDGFSGMLAIHPAQVDVINRAFVPTAAELERAQRIVELFEANPGAGTLGLDGEMIDRPHFVQAQRILQLARRLAAL
ncbi:MAG: HpcH/HpaI aldolase/citrate lyase family protein [Woeseiaceae bacterium]|nr:HpcH/HpaI aldolase/citrate lyase family protein [Woeseiaceae bacterium]NIP21431.1 HpcH/HpaI aldolase/citrate lyase family protein [Woeseiaceae bacterium]NIS90356.1 HpcH/HpaI aldolase/citrate lyase family protein [Woeseiaceae bacterium]